MHLYLSQVGRVRALEDIRAIRVAVAPHYKPDTFRRLQSDLAAEAKGEEHRTRVIEGTENIRRFVRGLGG